MFFIVKTFDYQSFNKLLLNTNREKRFFKKNGIFT